MLGATLSAWREDPRLRLRRLLLKVSRSDNPRVRDGYRWTREVVRDSLVKATGRPLGWVAHLEAAAWTGPTTFELRGWAYERGYGDERPPRTEVWLQSGEHRVPAEVEQRSDSEVNAAAVAAEHDYANTAFTARFELAALLEHVDDPAVVAEGWTTRVRVRRAGRDRTGGFRNRFRFGSTRHLSTHTFADDVQVLPTWSAAQGGLRFGCRRATVLAHEVAFEGRTFVATVTSTGPALVGASIQTDISLAPLSCTAVEPVDGRPAYRLEGTVPGDVPVVHGTAPLSVNRQVLVLAADGLTHPVATGLDDASPTLTPGSALLAASGADGTLTLLDAPARILVDSCVVEPAPSPHLRLTGRFQLAAGDVASLTFEGARQLLPVEATFEAGVDGQGSWSAQVPLLVSVWERPALPPRPGNYILRALTADGVALPVSAVPAVSASAPRMHELDRFRLRLQSGGARSLRFRISPPRRPDELGSYHQRRLRLESRGRSWRPRNAVYFESFYGRAATCNPYALDREIARHYPQLTRFWGVVDASIPVPEGAIAVVRGTREWWHARATARYVVANDWLRRTFVPQPFQVVLQTWHGSMLKRIGLDRPNQPPAKLAVIRTEQAKWDALVSQNHHSTLILESAYDWHKTMLEEGYPRNDPLTPGSPVAGDGAAIRARLGIAPEQTAVLYAPTWRENQTSMVTFLDLEKLSADLGPDYVILLRGHSRTVAFGESVDDLPGIVDVTTYPEVTELFLAADALITDYSSVMFDFSVTRRPMIFFVPDMADYRDSGRGVYFDLSEVAPGPVLATQPEVTAAIRELDRSGERYAAAYDAWVARFNHLDDGHSAERVVRRLLAIRKTPAP